MEVDEEVSSHDLSVSRIIEQRLTLFTLAVTPGPSRTQWDCASNSSTYDA